MTFPSSQILIPFVSSDAINDLLKPGRHSFKEWAEGVQKRLEETLNDPVKLKLLEDKFVAVHIIPKLFPEAKRWTAAEEREWEQAWVDGLKEGKS